MQEYIEYKIPFIFSSDAASGATNISSDGSSFEVNLDRPLVIPRTAKNCYLTVQNATAWWNIYNVEEDVNDKLDVTYDDGMIVVNQIIQIDSGLYDLDHLQEELARELLANNFPSDLFVFLPDQATQKTVIQFNYSGVRLDFSTPDNFAALVGFNERLVPLAAPTTGIQYEKSDNIAAFNVIDYLLIKSDLVSRGIRINDSFQNVIAQLLINVQPGSQILSTPFNPPPINCEELIGEKRKNIRFFLTDQNANPVNTRGETFSCRLVIHYTMKA